MTPVEQKHMAVFDENGDNLQRGDCMSACVASILDLPLNQVPFFVESDDWYADYHRFFQERGLCIERAWINVDENDPTKLTGWPSDRYWLATVKSPRGKTRCTVCDGKGETQRDWSRELAAYVDHAEPVPCSYCEATGLISPLHCVVMYGKEIVWDPHPQRHLGHLGFVGGEQIGVPDPARVTLKTTGELVAH